MSEYPIPEDLKEEYEIVCKFKNAPVMRLKELIERIARLSSEKVILAKDALRYAEENTRLREALEGIESLLSGEIRERFGGHPSKSEEELGRNSRVYSLLVVPRNMARAALAEKGLI